MKNTLSAWFHNIDMAIIELSLIAIERFTTVMLDFYANHYPFSYLEINSLESVRNFEDMMDEWLAEEYRCSSRYTERMLYNETRRYKDHALRRSFDVV